MDKAKLTSGTRVSLDMTTLTIMRALPREVRMHACMHARHLEVPEEAAVATAMAMQQRPHTAQQESRGCSTARLRKRSARERPEPFCPCVLPHGLQRVPPLVV